MLKGNKYVMTSDDSLAWTLEIPGDLLRKIRTQAEAEGLKGDKGVITWLTREAIRFIKSRAKTGGDLSPTEVKTELGIKQWVYRNLVRENAFPNLYYVNSRVVRIPRADVEAYKASRARSIA